MNPAGMGLTHIEVSNMPVVKCRCCGAVATAQLRSDQIETSYGASFREHCRALEDLGGPDFVSSVTECPFMDTAVAKLAMRLSRRAAREKLPRQKSAARKIEAIG